MMKEALARFIKDQQPQWLNKEQMDERLQHNYKHCEQQQQQQITTDNLLLDHEEHPPRDHVCTPQCFWSRKQE